MKYLSWVITTRYVQGIDIKSVESIDNFQRMSVINNKKGIKIDEFGMFPEFDMTNYVNVMGYFSNTDWNRMKSYTRVDCKINLVAVQKYAMGKVDKLISEY